MLHGVMRVGLVSKGLLLKGDSNLELVLLCATKPTVHLLKDVAEKLTAQLEVQHRTDYLPSTWHLVTSSSIAASFEQEKSAGIYTVSQCPGDAAVAVTSTKSILTLSIHVTSPSVRTEQESSSAEATEGNGGMNVVATSSQPEPFCAWSACCFCAGAVLLHWSTHSVLTLRGPPLRRHDQII